MFAECVKAVLQSETYLYTQRGFASGQEYQDNWDVSHPDSFAVIIRTWTSSRAAGSTISVRSLGPATCFTGTRT